MHIEYLAYFKDFSESLSVSRTAEKYYMTPQGLSRALHQMERDFGVTLMVHKNNRIELTPAGAALARRCGELVSLYQEMQGEMSVFQMQSLSKSSDIVRITVTSCVAQYVIALLGIQKPGIFPFNVRLNESNIFRIMPHLITRDNDEGMGIVSIPSTERYQQLLGEMVAENNMIYQPLFYSPLTAIMSRYSNLASKKVITPEDVRDVPVSRYQDTVLGDALDDYIPMVNVVAVSNTRDVVLGEVMERQAITFGPRLVEGIGMMPDGVVTRPTEGFFDTEFGFLLNPDYEGSEHICSVIDYVKRKIAKEAAGMRYGGKFRIA